MNQEESEQNEVDGMKGADSTGEMMLFSQALLYRLSIVHCSLLCAQMIY